MFTPCSSVKAKVLQDGKENLEPHMIRASVDLRVPNQYMERHKITQGTVVEDFTYKFHDCVIFSKLDMRQGYHQLLLDPESRKIATFSIPWGNFRPKRLIFGRKSSKDLFDETIYSISGDIHIHILGILLMNSCNTDIFFLATTIICSLSA